MFFKVLFRLIILAGLFLVLKNISFISKKFTPKTSNSNNNSASLATALTVKGDSVWSSFYPYTQRQKVNEKDNIYPSQQLEIGPLSQLTIVFRKGYRINLLQNTIALVTQDINKAKLTILRGHYTIDSSGQPNSLIIISNHPEFNIEPNSTSVLKISTILGTPVAKLANKKKENIPPSPLKPKIADSLSTEQIQKTIFKQKYWFNKCYTSHLKKTPTSPGGEVSLSFQILSDGKMQKTSIIKSDISDETFQDCLLEALNRVRFARSQRKTQKVILPIHFGAE